jgi:hypothetical protein
LPFLDSHEWEPRNGLECLVVEQPFVNRTK